MNKTTIKPNNKEEENEIDLKVISEYEENLKDDCVEFYEHSEVKTILGL